MSAEWRECLPYFVRVRVWVYLSRMSDNRARGSKIRTPMQQNNKLLYKVVSGHTVLRSILNSEGASEGYSGTIFFCGSIRKRVCVT